MVKERSESFAGFCPSFCEGNRGGSRIQQMAEPHKSFLMGWPSAKTRVRSLRVQWKKKQYHCYIGNQTEKDLLPSILCWLSSQLIWMQLELQPIYWTTVINEILTDEDFHLIGSLITPLTVTRTFLGPALSLCSQSHTPWDLGEGEGDHLPGAEGHSAVADGKGEIGPEQAGLVWWWDFISWNTKSSLSTFAWAGMSSGPSQECLNGICSGTSLGAKSFFLRTLQRIKFAQLLAQQQQSGRLGSCRLRSTMQQHQRETTHWQRYTA